MELSQVQAEVARENQYIVKALPVLNFPQGRLIDWNFCHCGELAGFGSRATLSRAVSSPLNLPLIVLLTIVFDLTTV